LESVIEPYAPAKVDEAAGNWKTFVLTSSTEVAVPALNSDAAYKKEVDSLKALEIKITAKAGGEKLFGSITNSDISEALGKAGHEIDRKFITSGIVKRTGKYSATVRLHREVIVELGYEIVAEKA
jgi:ribosomal protein L9